MSNYTCPSECLFANHSGKEHEAWIAEDETRKRLDMIVGTSSPFEEAVRLILDEFYVAPKDPALPLPAAVHAATMVVVNEYGPRLPKSVNHYPGPSEQYDLTK